MRASDSRGTSSRIFRFIGRVLAPMSPWNRSLQSLRLPFVDRSLLLSVSRLADFHTVAGSRSYRWIKSKTLLESDSSFIRHMANTGSHFNSETHLVIDAIVADAHTPAVNFRSIDFAGFLQKSAEKNALKSHFSRYKP